MGSSWCASLSVGPLPPSLFFPSYHRQAVTVGAAPSPAFVIIVTAVIAMLLGVSPVTDARALQPGGSAHSQKQVCDIEQCWDLYLNSQDYYHIQTDFEPISHPHEDPEQWQGRCISQRTFFVCLKAMYRNKSLDCHSDIGFRSAHNGIEKRMQEINCSVAGPTFDPSTMPVIVGQVCTYDGPPAIRYCSLFGDPHLRTFFDEFETCQIQGAWPLLENRYLTVQVTSKAVNNMYGPATAITELTVMIKQHDDCAAQRFVTYQAEGAFLPPMFDDGSVHFGPDKSVELREVVPDRHIEIFLRYIDTHVVIRRYPNIDTSFLTVSLRMPETILNQSVSYAPDGGSTVRTLELCSQGCPANQKIPYAEYLARGVDTQRIGSSTHPLFTGEKNSVDGMMVMMARDEALLRCRQLNLVDFYLDSCVFDLMNTGDTNFSQAAADSMDDTIRLHPDHGAALQNRTTLILKEHYNESHVNNSAQTVNNLRYMHRTTIVLLVAMVTCALNSIWWSPMVLTMATT